MEALSSAVALKLDTFTGYVLVILENEAYSALLLNKLDMGVDNICATLQKTRHLGQTTT